MLYFNKEFIKKNKKEREREKEREKERKREREKDKERERERENFCLLTHYPSLQFKIICIL